jgi:hypothetical protein
MVHLAGLSNLEWLWLDSTQVTDAGLAHLTGLTGLQHINLNFTPVTDAGLMHLKGLTGLRELEIELGNIHVTEEGVAELQRALPGLVVIDDSEISQRALPLSIDKNIAKRSGYSKIPQARQIDEFFGKAEHRVADEGDETDEGIKEEWISEVYFGGRYLLVMTVDIRVDRRTSEVSKIIGTPVFQLLEIQSVDMSSGAPRLHHRAPGGREFNAADWDKIVAAKGDFSAIGIQMHEDGPISNFDDLLKWSRSRSRPRKAR